MPAPAHCPVVYQLCPAAPEAHLFEVSCRVENPDPVGQVFTLPVWIPGSYMIREFAKNIAEAIAAAPLCEQRSSAEVGSVGGASSPTASAPTPTPTPHHSGEHR